MTRYPWSVDRAMNHGGDLADFLGEELKFSRKNGLHSVREGFVGLMVDFDEKAIGTDGDSGAQQREHFVAASGSVAGIHENGKVAALLHRGDDRQIEGVARMVRESAHAALAEDHAVVALGKDVFGSHQEFVESGRH